MTQLAQPVSIFQGSARVIPVETVSLRTVLDRIQDGTYRPYVERLRTILASHGKDAYRLAKEKSDAFTPCCLLTTRAKTVPWEQKLVSCTGQVHLDLDGVDDPEALKAALAQQPSVVFAFVSPRGDGLKINIAATGITDAASYKHAWTVVVKQVQQDYPGVHINLDAHVSFVNALCYMAYEPTPYVNPQAEALSIPSMITPAPTPRPTPRLHPLPQGTRDRHTQRAITIAVGMIEDAPEHHQHHARLRAARLLGGYVAGGLLTYAEAYGVLEAPTEAQAKNVRAAMQTIADGLTYGQAAPITLEELEAEWESYRARTYYRRATPTPSIFSRPLPQEGSPWHS